MAIRLTEKGIQRINQAGEVGDAATTGLYLRTAPAGRKTWRYRYQLRGKTRIMTMGNWPDLSLADARKKATAARADLLDGTDPAAAAQREQSARRSMPTVEEFIGEYVKRYAQRHKKSWHQDQLILERWLVPSIGRLRMDEVTRRDVVKILDDCRDTGATRQPGKILAVTRVLFKFAIQRGVLDTTPCSYIEESQPEPAQRAMTEAEIKTWWTATGEALESDTPAIHKPTALALRVLLLTGQRPGEVAAMTRDELHLDSPLGPHWIISGERRKKGRAKQGKPHAVALQPEAVAAIESALKYSNGEYVFEKASGGPVRTDSGLSVALGRIFGDPPRPTPHAARHTVATELAEMGIDEYHIGRVLGHVSKTVTGTVYINNRVNEAALGNQRTLLARWEKRLAEIVTGEKAVDNVVTMQAAGR
jgi:integrase